jgi:hypothetical protein
VVDRREGDIDDDWGNGAEQAGDRPAVPSDGDAGGSDKVDTAKNRLARVDERVRIDSTEEAAPISRRSLPTVPPPSDYDEVRRTAKRQAFDLEAALEKRALRDAGVAQVDGAPPPSSPFFAAGDLPPLPPSTQAPPTLIDVAGRPPRPIAPIIAAVVVASVVATGIAVYGITMMRSSPTPVLASASVAPPSPPPPPSPLPTVETIVPAIIDAPTEHATTQPAAPAPIPSPRITAAPTPSIPPSAPPPPPAPKPSAPSAPAHAPSATTTAAPGVEFLKRNL